jgi:hypothetical protein
VTELFSNFSKSFRCFSNNTPPKDFNLRKPCNVLWFFNLSVVGEFKFLGIQFEFLSAQHTDLRNELCSSSAAACEPQVCCAKLALLSTLIGKLPTPTRPAHFLGYLKLYSTTRPPRHTPPSTSLALMTTTKRLRALKNTAMRGLRAAAQAQLQPPRTYHCNTQPSSAMWHLNPATAAVAVTLCFISMAAAQPGQCPAAWTTAALSVARGYLAATSLPNQGLAIFAGGQIRGTHVLFVFLTF